MNRDKISCPDTSQQVLQSFIRETEVVRYVHVGNTSHMTPLAVLVGTAVLFGAATQRITGMGFALVSAPVLVLVLGAGSGVPLIQILGILSSLLVFAATFRDVSWRKAAALALPATAGLLPGRWIAHNVPEPILLIVIGLMVIAALLAMVASERARIFRGIPGLLGAGFLSGFMNVVAGVGGPAMVLYKLSTGWSHRQFVATLQVYFMALGMGAILALGWPSLPGEVWAGALAGLALGILVGHGLSRRVPVTLASRLVVVVALTGAVTTVVQGLLKLSA